MRLSARPLAALVFASVCGWASSSLAATWLIDPGRSEIAFSGTHSGRAFKGVFQKWTGTIDFDPDIPETAKIEIVVDLASAKTGDATYDRTLPQKDWLDTAASAKATFTTSAVRRGEAPGQYVADGSLTLRGKAAAVTLPFTLTIDGDKAEMSGRAQLRRLDFGIGQSSDAGGSWVSVDIPVEVKVSATKQ
ncbi:YceI family protein [Enterovirga rhinocerotis]|uniref:Polyisoprenoid-binding protein YceI n=1 Tax=Enterovirga rhinocerotis TaxID=1339210 RepID=A0A4R7C5J9_9HYPH|nr:YceI family protein [Enterovirga rhinocerotis]TDR93471.1 polyisoprenoid-binding protein YceI [Enterovirga rhinocerotis]